jgi:hypothetical protein
MRSLGTGDMVYVFMGESLLHVKVIHYYDDIRFQAEDGDNTYCFYTKDAYLTKEEAIRGMLDSIRELTECDCGEDEETIQDMLYRCS